MSKFQTKWYSSTCSYTPPQVYAIETRDSINKGSFAKSKTSTRNQISDKIMYCYFLKINLDTKRENESNITSLRVNLVGRKKPRVSRR